MKKYAIKILCAMAAVVLIIVGVFIWQGFFAAPSHLHRLEAEEVSQAGLYTADKKYVACTFNREDITALVSALNEGSFKKAAKKEGSSDWVAPFFFQMEDYSVLKITLDEQYLMIGDDCYRCDEGTRAKFKECYDRHLAILEK